MTVYFGVKYYATDPCKLAEEITRYQFFLQCKQDILHGRLPISFELAIELFGLAIQSELGDYDPQRHQDGYVGEFSFVPNQTLELEQRAALFHRQHLVGQVPATAELNFLERIKWLDLYGCELHPIQYDEGDYQDQYALGLNPSGVLVLHNKIKVAQYFWPRIVKTKCQGRCFLMDVIMTGNNGGDLQQQQQQLLANGKTKTVQANTLKRNRFGFRLADKEAARRLRWSIEEHKQFYHLIHSTASLNQLAGRQQHIQMQMQAQVQAQALAAAEQQHQQQLKLSQRFRNSIRSAINLGAHFNNFQHQQQQQQHITAIQQQQQQQHQQKLRSSSKSINPSLMHHHYTIDRQPPTVVRMPSRRYSNRSLPRPGATGSGSKQYSYQQVGANDNGLPAVVGSSQQRQRAMLMMANQFNQDQQHFLLPHQPGLPMGKSQTLKPISSKEAKQRGSNPYYQMMMMMMAAQQQQQQHQSQKNQLPEVSILPPGQHIVQPSIYRASSVVDGINQLSGAQQQQQQQHKPSMMQQFFNTRPQQQAGQYRHQQASGHESPRSTKSAMAPSSALRLASKKLAKQQQLLYGNDASDVRPLLACADLSGNVLDPQHDIQVYSNTLGTYYPAGAYSAAASPRSARSARLSWSSSKHRSKSTGENLHMLHRMPANNMVTNKNSNKLLLATANPLDAVQNLPPPDYESSSTTVPMRQHRSIVGAGLQDLVGKNKLAQSPKRSINSTISYNIDPFIDLKHFSAQKNLSRRNSVATNKLNDGRYTSTTGDIRDEDDDYCSRSDCSSVGDRSSGANRKQIKPRHQMSQLDQVRQMAGESRQEWDNIRRRHDELASGKDPSRHYQHENSQMIDQQIACNSPMNNNTKSSSSLGRPHRHRDTDTNNNDSLGGNLAASQQVKNITNKQATPILLSMNNQFVDNQTKMNPNNKAVQLLNLQRQQLNSQSSDGSASNRTNITSSGSDSVPSSVASSPKAPDDLVDKQKSTNGHHRHHNAADSTASTSTTTSGYYAGSNSTGPTSVDSDTISGDCQPLASSVTAVPNNSQSKQQSRQLTSVSYNNKSLSNWTPNANIYAEGTRARMALGVHGNVPRGEDVPSDSRAAINSGSGNGNRPSTGSNSRIRQQHRFYLGESNNNSDEHDTRQVKLNQHQWAQLEQQNKNSQSSLKYVSFDV